MEDCSRIIQFDRLSTNGIVYEEVSQFGSSIFADVYDKARTLVEKIIFENNIMEKTNLFAKHHAANSEIANVISFIGRRGTGKTSAMLSFYEALLHNVPYHVGSEDSFFGMSIEKRKENTDCLDMTGFKKYKFFGLECIDASSLEDSEDVFVLVLASMLDQILELSKNNSLELYEYENRSILQSFERLYEDFLILKKSSEWDGDGYSSFEKLKNIASSRKIRIQFADLVEKYLEVMTTGISGKSRKRESYLVIAIDDLDMRRHGMCSKAADKRQKGSYEIMRSIHQYLSVPRVIVLTAYNHELLYDECVRYFGNQTKMASQFMEKVFAVNTRLYMPSWRKRDFDNESQLKVNIEDNKKGILQSFQKKGIKELPVKRFVLALLGEKADIYYDCEGKKRHFFEPDTLRSLYSLTACLLYLGEYGSVMEPDMNLDVYESNIKRLKEDFYFRYAKEKLQKPEEKILFEQWLEQKIERRSESIVAQMCKHTQKLGKATKMEYQGLVSQTKWIHFLRTEGYGEDSLDNSNVEYSYAELIHSIYHMTRDEQLGYSKELIACILESYTLYLTGIYRRYSCYKRKLSKKDYWEYFGRRQLTENDINRIKDTDKQKLVGEIWKCSEIFESIIGKTICGKWTEYYFPEIKTNLSRADQLYENKKRYNYIIGYVDDYSIPYEVIFDKIQFADLESEEKLNEFESDITLKIYQVLFVAMLQTNVFIWPDDKILCEYMCDMEGQNPVLKFTVRDMRTQIKDDVELTGCFKYTIFYARFLKRMETLFVQSMEKLKKEDAETGKEKKLNEKELKLIERYMKIIKDVFNKICKEYYDWDMRYGNMMIPIYNLDLSYNIVKRAFQDCKKENMAPVYINDENSKYVFLEQYKKMLDRFLKHFQTIDKYYCLEELPKGFEQVFHNCPHYKMLIKLLSDEESNKRISFCINSMVIMLDGRENILSEPENQDLGDDNT